MLPIGTVVKIKGIKKPIMIFGMLQRIGGEQVRVVDYIGVPYPEGNIGSYAQIGFMKKDIVEVLYEGYRTDELEKWEKLFAENSSKE